MQKHGLRVASHRNEISHSYLTLFKIQMRRQSAGYGFSGASATWMSPPQRPGMGSQRS